VRVDSGFGEGAEVPREYDSLVAKLVSWGPTREESRRRMIRALDEFEIEGIATTIPAHRVLLESPEFLDGSYTTRLVEEGALDALKPEATPAAPAGPAGAVLMVGSQPVRLWHPAVAAFSGGTGGSADAGTGAVAAPMHGTILKLLVNEGDRVEAGDPVAILEAMKMETHLAATASGTVTAIRVDAGEVVEAGQVVAVIA